MSPWTPEAQQIIERYLDDVARMATARGEDGDELRTNLREHIDSEIASREWEPVTAEQARQLVAQLGAPEDIVGGEIPVAAPPPPPIPIAATPAQASPVAPAAVPQAPAQKQGIRWFSPVGCLIMLVIGLVLLVVLVISLPILSILAAILLPALSRANGTAEAARQQAEIQKVMQQIAAAQIAFQQSATFDNNNDGIGDYGSIEQLNAFLENDIEWEQEGFTITLQVVFGTEDTNPQYLCEANPTEDNRVPNRRYWLNSAGQLQHADDAQSRERNTEYIP